MEIMISVVGFGMSSLSLLPALADWMHGFLTTQASPDDCLGHESLTDYTPPFSPERTHVPYNVQCVNSMLGTYMLFEKVQMIKVKQNQYEFY